jgi:hypothetical protein
MCDRRSERALSPGALDIDMDPLTIAGAVSFPTKFSSVAKVSAVISGSAPEKCPA